MLYNWRNLQNTCKISHYLYLASFNFINLKMKEKYFEM